MDEGGNGRGGTGEGGGGRGDVGTGGWGGHWIVGSRTQDGETGKRGGGEMMDGWDGGGGDAGGETRGRGRAEQRDGGTGVPSTGRRPPRETDGQAKPRGLRADPRTAGGRRGPPRPT